MSLLSRRSADEQTAQAGEAAGATGKPPAPAVDPLFSFEARHGGRPVAVLRAVQTPDGITVETEIHPVGAIPGEGVVQRPFSFSTAAQARRFGDEALTALEYLGCSAT